MLRTYKAILHDNQVEWLEQPPEKSECGAGLYYGLGGTGF